MKQIAILFSLLFAVGQLRADLFAPFNKYQLSFGLLDSIRSAALDSAAPPFFSQPLVLDAPRRHYCVGYGIADQQVQGSIFASLSGDVYDSLFIPNGFVGSRIDYRSRWLAAALQVDVHSNKVLPTNSIADSLGDLKTEQFVSGAEHIEGTGSMDFNFPLGYLEVNARPLTFRTGKFKLRWGPGYKGTLALSGTTISPFYYYYLSVGLGKALRASCFLNQFDDEYKFIDSTTDRTRLNPPRFGAGQRVDVRLGRHVQLGLYELVNFYGVNLLARYANPVQLYYFENTAGGPAEMQTNIMGGLDANVLAGPMRFYGDFLNDDITVFDHNGSPNKFAFQVGSVYYGRSVLQEIGAEFTHIAWGVYTHWYPGLDRHLYWGEPRGWPWGNDQDVWNVHALLKIRDDLRLYGEIDWWIKGEGIMDLYHWDYVHANDTPVPGHGDNQGGLQDYAHDRMLASLLLEASYQPRDWATATIAYRPAVMKQRIIHQARIFCTVEVPGRWDIAKKN
jgi:hypothetical protein